MGSSSKKAPVFNALILSFSSVLAIIVLFANDLSLLLIAIVLGGLVIAFLYAQEWEIRDSYLIIFLIFCSLVSPPIQLPGGLPDIRLEELIIYIAMPFLLYLRRNQLPETAKKFALLFLIFICLQVFSTLYGRLFHSVPVGIRDFFEIVKSFKYLLLITFISTASIDKSDLKAIIIALITIFAISALIGLMQYFSVAGMDRITGSLFVQERYYDINRRMMGTFYNPNTYGTVISLGIAFTLSYMMYVQKVTTKFLLFSVIIFLSWTVFLTQSRTALGVLIIAMLILIIREALSNKGNKLGIFTILSLFIIIFVGIISTLSSDIITRYTSALNLMEDESWQARLIAWYINLQVFLDSILFGYGPAKHLHTTIVDSEYILTLRQFGIIGFAMNLYSFYIFPLTIANKTSYRTDILGYYSKAFVAGSVIFLIANITNPLFHEIQFMDFWCITIGLLFAIQKNTISDPV